MKNLQKKYPKAWADFKEWLDNFPSPDNKNHLIVFDGFDDYPFEMQLGVYLKYLDEKCKGLTYWVSNDEDEGSELHYDSGSKGGSCFIPKDDKKTIEQAFKIREEELTNKQK